MCQIIDMCHDLYKSSALEHWTQAYSIALLRRILHTHENQACEHEFQKVNNCAYERIHVDGEDFVLLTSLSTLRVLLLLIIWWTLVSDLPTNFFNVNPLTWEVHKSRVEKW